MKAKKTVLIYLMLSMILLGSCDQPQPAEQSTAESTQSEPDIAAEKYIAMVVSNQVKNYLSWHAFFDMIPGVKAREAAQLKVNGIYRDITDSNYVSVMMKAGSLKAAKEFAASENFKTLNVSQGVVGEPEVKFYEILYVKEEITSDNTAKNADTATNNPNPAVKKKEPTVIKNIADNRVFIICKVQDYEVFKKVFDDREKVRTEKGITTEVIARNLDDANEIAIALSASDMNILKQHMEDPSVKEAMQAAGVIGEPTLMFAKAITLGAV